MGLLGRQPLGQQRQLHGSAPADKAGQHEGGATVRHQPNAGKRLQKVAGLGGADDVADHGEAHADSGRRTIDCGDDGHVEIAQGQQQRMVAAAQAVAGTALAFAAALILQIGARAKAAAFTGKQQASGAVGRLARFRHSFGEIAEHLRADSVHHFRMIEFDYGYLAVKVQRHAFH